jgi:acyl dehydratase
MPRAPASWEGIAFNQATASENRIHADDVARRYGFRGGLVPGVTVYAYCVQPAVAAWGLDWLARGAARVKLQKPLYDGARFRVETSPGGAAAFAATLTDPDGVVCATADVSLPAAASPPPTRRGDPPVPPLEDRPDATREALERLRERGLGSIHLRWQGRGELDRTTRSLDAMPDLIRPDRGGFAHPAFTLGVANWILAANVRLGPWIHVESDVRHHAAIPLGAALEVEGRVVDLFARGGHEFVDLDVAVFVAPDAPALAARHRAIYRLREPG